MSNSEAIMLEHREILATPVREESSPKEGPKYDDGKLQYSLIPPIATEALASVLTFGANKYRPNSWMHVKNGEKRYLDALMRHLEAYRSGEVTDPESALSHLSHLITNAAFLLHFQKERLNASEEQTNDTH